MTQATALPGAAQLPGDVSQKTRLIARSEPGRCIRDGVEHRIEPFRVGLGEVVQHEMHHRVLGARMADADAHAHVLVADVSGNRAQSVVPGVAAAGLDLDLAGRRSSSSWNTMMSPERP